SLLARRPPGPTSFPYTTLFRSDRPLVRRDAQLLEELVGVERLVPAGALADQQRLELRALVGREAAQAVQALAAATDGGALVGRARVDDLGVLGRAVRAAHQRFLKRSSPSRTGGRSGRPGS